MHSPTLTKISLLLALVLVAFSGCMSSGPGGVPAPNATVLKAAILDAAENTTSYSFDMENTMTEGAKNLSGENASLESTKLIVYHKESGTISLDKDNASNRKMMYTSTDELRSGETVLVTDTKKTYMLNDTIYQELKGNWTRLYMPYPDYEWFAANRLSFQIDLLNRSQLEVLGSEKVDGVDCYKIKVVPDNSTYSAILAMQMSPVLQAPAFIIMASINQTELFDSSGIDWTAWVSKEGYNLIKKEMQTSTRITPELLGRNESLGDFEISIDDQEIVKFADHNKPVEIVVPPEAMSAPMLAPSAQA